MSNLEKIYPINIFGVKSVGYEQWVNSHYNHITPSEFNDIYDFVLNAYTKSFCTGNKNDELYYVAISNIKIAKQVALSIYDLINIYRLKQHGYTHVLGKKTVSLEEYRDNILRSRVRYPYKVQKMRGLRYLKYSYLTLKSYLYGVILRKDLVATIGAESKLTRMFAKHRNIITYPIYVQRYIYSNTNRKYSYDFNRVINLFLNELKPQYPFLTPIFIKDLKETLNDRFLESYDLMMKYKNYFKIFKTKKVLVNGLGSPLHMLIASAYKLSGSEVIGFTHGNNYVRLYNKNISMMDGVGCLDELNASSFGEKIFVEKMLSNHPTNINFTNNISFTSNYYKWIFEGLQKKTSFNGKIKKVMVIGCGQNDETYIGEAYHLVLSRLKLEFKIVMSLLNNGFEVIYKAHPDRKGNSDWVFDDLVDNIEYTPFEECYDQADCIIFPSVGTTTFGFSLMTKKPMVLFYYKELKIFPEVMELMKKRCRVVPVIVDDQDNINFNEDELSAAISSSTYPLEHDIVHKYAL